jgi:hypothetical protein
LIGGLATAGWTLPGDSLVSLGGFDSSRVLVAVDRQQGRTLMRHKLSLVRSTEDWSLRFVDTSLFRYAGTPGILGGETLLQMGWMQRADSGWSASWRLWNRADGLTAPDPSLGENAWRQMPMARGAMGVGSLATSLALGALLERTDPGRASPGFRGDDEPPRGLRGAGAWAWEGAWAGFAESPASFGAHWSDLFASTALHQASLGLEAAIQASLLGEGRDSLRLEIAADSSRVRSGYLLSDRADAQRYAGVRWTLPAGRQTWNASGSVWNTIARDFSGRNADLTKNGFDGMVGLDGPLLRGWRHRQVFEFTDEKRVLTSASTGDLLADEITKAQDRRDRDQTSTYTLSDSLHWRTERWSGIDIAFGVTQSLRTIRHPSNPSPVSADRPDEDVARKQFSVLLRSDKVLSGDKPTLAWTSMTQQDVYLRAVHSFNSWNRDENRLSANLTIPVNEYARPVLAGWAREQRDSWRFQPSKRKGRLEYGMTLGAEVGPQRLPWASFQWTRWEVKSGDVRGEDFAPDQIQDVWDPEIRGYYRWNDRLRVEPWSSLYLERVESWQGKGWNVGVRSRSVRVGGDLVQDGPSGGFTFSCGRLWNSPGEDAWIGSLSARYTW